MCLTYWGTPIQNDPYEKMFYFLTTCFHQLFVLITFPHQNKIEKKWEIYYFLLFNLDLNNIAGGTTQSDLAVKGEVEDTIFSLQKTMVLACTRKNSNFCEFWKVWPDQKYICDL